MGLKILQASVALSALSVMLTLVCCTQVWHATVFTAFGIPAVIRMETSATHISFTSCGSGTISGAILRSVSSVCKEAPKSQDLHTFSQTTCSGVINTFFPTMCSATQSAYSLGLVVIIASVVNAILQGVGAYLAFEYASKFRKNYRQTWLLLLCIGAFIQFLSIVLYQFLAILEMDNMRSNIVILQPGNGMGTTISFMLLYVGVALEILAIVLAQYCKFSQEALEEERRANEKFSEEVNLYGQAIAAASADPQQSGMYYGSAGNGLTGLQQSMPQQPLMPQPQWGAAQSGDFGLQQAAMPPQQWGATPLPQPPPMQSGQQLGAPAW